MATTTASSAGLGTKKSVFVLITVVGCIAILWPKILYFAMFGGGQQTTKTFVKDHRSGTGLRQERPPHLRVDGIHPAMRERGRAIPATATVPIIAQPKPIPPTAPRIVEGRPGPIPGMRPPLGAGSNHQANQKGNSLGFIMPLYTVGIVAFFVYTIMKLVMKKPIKNAPYAEAIKSNPEFQSQVFGQEKSVSKKMDGNLTNIGWKDHDTIVTAIQGLIDAADEQLNKKTYSTNLSKDITDTCGNGNLHTNNGNLKVSQEEPAITKEDEDVIHTLNKKIKNLENGSTKSSDLKAKDIHNDKSVKAVNNEKPVAEPQSIFLEGSLPHDSQILVADSETKTEKVFDDELDDSKEEPAVVICSKMTLSLINMDPMDKSGGNGNNDYDDNDDAEIEDEEIEEIEEIEDEEVEVEVVKTAKVETNNDIAKLNAKQVEKEQSEDDEEEEEEEYEEEEEEYEEEVDESGDELQS